MFIRIRTGTTNNAYLAGVKILQSEEKDHAERVSAMALKALASMSARTQKVESVDDRVAVIIENIRQGEKEPKVRIFAQYAINDYCGDGWCVEPQDYEGEISALHWLIRNNVRYGLDAYGHDLYNSAVRTLEAAGGDCDCIAGLSGAAFRSIGYPVKVKVIRTRGNDTFHHVYIIVGYPPENPTNWIPLDAAYYDQAGQEAPGIVEHKLYEVD